MYIIVFLLLVLPAASLHSESQDNKSGHITGCDTVLPPHLQAITAKQDCPTWFTGDRNSGCECHDVPGVACRSNYALVFINSCVTLNVDRDQLQVALCPFGIALDKSDYVENLWIKLPDNRSEVNDYFCAGLKRTGVLCSKCETGLGPPVLSYSFKCVQCLPSPYGWLLYIFLACFPTTVFSLLVFLFQVKANSPQLNFVVFICQYLALVQVHGFQRTRVFNCVITFYSLWNLEYLCYTVPPFCISERMSLVDVYALE